MAWSEGKIARAIALQTLARRCVVLVDRCNWTGHECDLLAVTTDLRIIDVEIKISRSDFKADASKDKWWHRLSYMEAQERGIDRQTWSPWSHRDKRYWPPRVWKHYYAMPSDVWTDDLLEFMPSPKSGLLLVSERRDSTTPVVVSCRRRATPNKDAARLTPEQTVNIARLANLRMWEAYRRHGSLEVESATA